MAPEESEFYVMLGFDFVGHDDAAQLWARGYKHTCASRVLCHAGFIA